MPRRSAIDATIRRWRKTLQGGGNQSIKSDSNFPVQLNEMILIPPALPQDVFDEIISQLAGETSTLKSCSLVCCSFRRNAQKMLFHSTVVRLTYRDPYSHNDYQYEAIGPSESIALISIVKHPPHLIEYIQELRISCSERMQAAFDESDDLANALGIFSRKGEFPINLRSLSLRFASGRWNHVDYCLQRALVLLISAYSLRHIFLEDIPVRVGCPAKLFQNLPPLLKHLSWTGTALSSLPTTRKEVPKLESLTICGLDKNVERIVNTTQLKTFEGGDCTRYSMPVIERILRPASNSLEHLTLRGFKITDPDSVSVNLNQFSRLTDITIHCDHTFRIPPMLILITKTMKKISHRNVIQNLSFHLSFHLKLGSDIDIVDFESAMKDVWQEVDTIWSIPQLVSSESFRGITFIIQSTARNCDEFSDLVQNKMPETKNASKLHIKTHFR